MPKPRAEFIVDADTDPAAKALKLLEGSVTGVGKAGRLFTASTGGLVLGLGAGDIFRRADEYNALSIRIRTATADTGDFNKIQKELLQTSTQTGVAFANSIDTFQAISRIRDDIGATNDQAVVFNRTIQQLGVIGGSSQQQLNDGIRQLTQGLAAGVFRAEEFNSIVENTPEIAKRIADGLGLTGGELRQLVLDGNLLSSDVFNVLLRQSGEIRAEFEDLPNTLSRSGEALGTSLSSALSALDQQVGATSFLARSIQRAADDIRKATGGATELEVLRDRLGDVLREQRDVQRELVRAKSPSFLDSLFGTAPEADEVRARYSQLVAESERLRAQITGIVDADPGQVTGGGPVDDPDAETREAARRERLLAATQKTFDALTEQKLRALDQDEQLEQFRFNNQIAALQDRRAELEAAGILDAELRAQLQQAETDAAIVHQQSILEIRRLAAEERRSLQEEEFFALQEVRELQHEEEIAQLLGFEDAKTRELVEAERRRQQEVFDLTFKGTVQQKKIVEGFRKFEEKNAADKAKFLLGTAEGLTANMAQNSRAVFNINKIAAIANAAVSTAQGAAQALRDVPYPLNIAAAATVVASGAAQIASIQSTQFGGGSSGLTSAGPGTGVPSLAGESLVPDLPEISAEDRNQTRLVIELPSSTGDEVTDALIRSIRVRVDDNDEVLFDRDSRQAIEIRGD